MSSIALITDTHYGGRKGSKNFHEYFRKFYEDIFFPELEKRKIKNCIHLGDAFDSRKSVDFWCLNWAKENVYDRFKDLGVTVYQLSVIMMHIIRTRMRSTPLILFCLNTIMLFLSLVLVSITLTDAKHSWFLGSLKKILKRRKKKSRKPKQKLHLVT